MKKANSIETWMSTFGAKVLQQIGEDYARYSKARIKALRQTDSHIVMRFEVEDEVLVVKSFVPYAEGAREHYTREVANLLKLRSSGLAPEIRFFSDENLFLVMDFVAGTPLSDEINEQNVLARATELGKWYAKYAEVLPGRTTETNWFDYLEKYENVLQEQNFDQSRQNLEKLAISRRTIAKNDAYLGNFIKHTGGALIGIDYEAASYKPFGWDILLTARVLVKRFPELIDEITAALVEGWNQGTDQISVGEFEQLVKHFALATAFRSTE